LIDLIYLFTQTCLKKATQIIATEDEQDSQAPCALIAALISLYPPRSGTGHQRV